MVHIAIMKASWKLTDRILFGEKTIETRWYKSKKTPIDNIKVGETIYFKDSGKPVSVIAKVSKVEQYSNLSNIKSNEILKNYDLKNIVPINLKSEYIKNTIGKNYVIFIHLKDVREIEPFNINKKGFGNMCSWLSFDNLEDIKLKD